MYLDTQLIEKTNIYKHLVFSFLTSVATNWQIHALEGLCMISTCLYKRPALIQVLWIFFLKPQGIIKDHFCILGVGKTMEVGGGGAYRVRQSMSSHVEHRSYDFADHSMSCLSSPALHMGTHLTVQGSTYSIVPSPGRSEFQKQPCRATLSWIQVVPLDYLNFGDIPH